jgi:hypothetical protein
VIAEAMTGGEDLSGPAADPRERVDRGADMGSKKAQEQRASQKTDKKGKKEIKPPKEVPVKVANVIGDPSIEGIADGKHIVLWMDVQGHGRIKVESKSPRVYSAKAADPGAAFAAEAGAEKYCEQHGEQLRELYSLLAAPCSS